MQSVLKYSPVVILFLLQVACSINYIDTDCKSSDPKELINGSRTFTVDANSKCNPSGIIVNNNAAYKISISIESDLSDGWVKWSSPEDSKTECLGCDKLGVDGFTTQRMNLIDKTVLFTTQWFRPIGSSKANWFELLVTTDKKHNKFTQIYTHTLEYNKLATYTPSDTGELLFIVNDFPWLGKYCNNKGQYKVTITNAASQ